jgi:hypothetical protein
MVLWLGEKFGSSLLPVLIRGPHASQYYAPDSTSQ